MSRRNSITAKRGRRNAEQVRKMWRYFRCVDCKADCEHEYYMVHNEVWKASGLGPSDGMLCIGCLEVRLGRRLVPGDFPAVALNLPDVWPVPRSDRFLDRLGVDK